MRRDIRARRFPAAAISASCVGRTLMIANSAATKKPFAMMKSRAKTRYQIGMSVIVEGGLFYRSRGCDDLVERFPEPGVGFGNDALVGNRDVSAR